MSTPARRDFLRVGAAIGLGALTTPVGLLAGDTPVSPAPPTLAPTPPMGWMSWNLFGPDVSDALLRETATAMITTGMRDAGYNYLCIDDLWQGGRDARGFLFAHPTRFPQGMKALADWLHANGFKLGIYSDAAEQTCGGEVGSYGHEVQDARTFAEWGIDYLKYDYCGAPEDPETAFARYATMSHALRATRRPMVFSICEWGAREPWLWARRAGGQLWRTSWDLRDSWETVYDSGHAGIMDILDRQVTLAEYAGPGGWNDPDQLVVGLHGRGKSSTVSGWPHCNDTEYRSQMSLWCLMASPLHVSCDIRSIDATSLETLVNRELLAVNQDALGRQARRAIKDRQIEIWKKPLANGDSAIGILNRGAEATEVKLRWTDIALAPKGTLRDLWAHQDLGPVTETVTLAVASHETRVLRYSPGR